MTSINTSFILRKNKKRKSGKIPIYLRISVNQNRAEISTKKYVDGSQWDYKLQKVKGRADNAKIINTYLEQLKYQVIKVESQLLKEEVNITTKTIKQRLLGKNKSKKIYLVDFFQKHNDRLKELIDTDYTISTYKKYETCLLHIRNFLAQNYSNSNFELQMVDFNFITDFEHYLKTKKNSCNHNSAVKYISHLKKVIYEARKQRIITNNPFDAYEINYHETDRVYLTTEELKAINEKELHVDRLNRIRDMFVFCCYTGLSYSDVIRLNKSNIIVDKGQASILIRRKKTHELSIIPLLEQANNIIDKYSDDPETVKGNLLPFVSNQKTNAYLKEIAHLAGINKHLTFHCARHTFATTITLENDVPIESVQNMLGHRDLRSTKHYAKITRRKLIKNMKKVQKKLNELT